MVAVPVRTCNRPTGAPSPWQGRRRVPAPRLGRSLALPARAGALRWPRPHARVTGDESRRGDRRVLVADVEAKDARARPAPGRIAAAAIAAFWLANVPAGMWLARAYYQAADAARVTFEGRAMSLWLLGVGVALVQMPGLL